MRIREVYGLDIILLCLLLMMYMIHWIWFGFPMFPSVSGAKTLAPVLCLAFEP
jgi:hypothetical protein